jgi:O-antigen ligase
MRRHSFQAWADRAAALALAALAAALPFELTRPAFAAGPLWLSTVEVLVYAALGLTGLAALIGARSLRSAPLPVGAGAIVAWMVVMLLSATLAREPRDDAAKFALRSVAAAGLAFGVARATALPWARGVILGALGIGAGLSATLGAYEGVDPSFAAALTPFRTQSFSLAGYPRAMGTFQYPTIAAMFWEAAAPVTVALLAARPFRSRLSAMLVTGLVGALFGAAIAATLSRAGLAVALGALLTLTLVAWRRFPQVLAPAAAGLAGFGLAAALVFLASPALSARLLSESDTALNRADVRVTSGAPASLAGGAPFTLTIEAANLGIEAWPARGARAVVASYHWVDPDRVTYLVFEGARTALPMDVAPGASVALELRGLAPTRAGRMLLQLDLQRQDGAWFTQKGNPMPEFLVEVTAAPLAPVETPATAARTYLPPAEQGEVGRLELWRVALRMAAERPLLGAGPDNFRHLYGTYLDRREFNTSIHANSLYFDTLANLGLAGLAAVLALGLAVARRAWVVIRVMPMDRGAWLAAAVLLSLGAYFAHGALDYFLEFTPTYGLFWLLAGCAAQPRRSLDRA